VPRLSRSAPSAPRRFDRTGVIAVEEIGAAGEGVEIRSFQPVDENQHRRAVRVPVAIGQPDRLQRRSAVARRTMRQERRLAIGPQRRIEMFDSFG
jgi:hypothetical protein